MKLLDICGRVVSAVALCIVCYGCAGPLPDVSPFVAASSQLRSGVASGGMATAAELARLPGGDADSARLGKEWAVRVRLCDALVRYAQSLQDITRSGAQGRESVQAVADAVTTLASAASIALPAANAVSVVTDTARFVYAQIALARASASLEAALTAAAPAVDEVTETIARDIAQLGSLLTAANDSYQKQAAQKYSTVLGYRRQLERRRSEAYSRLGTDREPGLGQELQQIATLLAASQDEYGIYEQEIADALKRRNAAKAVVRAAAEAVSQWGAAHRGLVAAVHEKRPVDVQSLVDSTVELRDLIRRMREL
jgi:hypothetical protein